MYPYVQKYSYLDLDIYRWTEGELGHGRTEWAWAGVPFGKGLPEGMVPGRQLSRSRAVQRAGTGGGAAQAGAVPERRAPSTFIRKGVIQLASVSCTFLDEYVLCLLFLLALRRR